MGTAARHRSTSTAMRSASPDTQRGAIEVASASVEVVSDREMRVVELQRQIDSGMALVKDGWREVWIAIAEIKRDRLFEVAGHKTLVDFCLEKFGWQKSYTYEIANAGQVTSGLLDAGFNAGDVPVFASQVVALLPVNELDRPEVLRQAIDRTEGKLTAEAIVEVVDEYLGKSESGKTFEEIQAMFATIPASVKTDRRGKFTWYVVEQLGKTASYKSLKEVESAFEKHQERAKSYANSADRSTEVTAFNGSSPAFDRSTDALPEQTSRLQDYDDRDTEEETIEPDSAALDETEVQSSVEPQEIAVVDEVVADVEEEESEEDFAGSSFDCYTALRNVVSRFSSLQGLGWGEVAIGNATDYLYGELTGMVQ